MLLLLLSPALAQPEPPATDAGPQCEAGMRTGERPQETERTAGSSGETVRNAGPGHVGLPTAAMSTNARSFGVLSSDAGCDPWCADPCSLGPQHTLWEMPLGPMSLRRPPKARW